MNCFVLHRIKYNLMLLHAIQSKTFEVQFLYNTEVEMSHFILVSHVIKRILYPLSYKFHETYSRRCFTAGQRHCIQSSSLTALVVVVLKRSSYLRYVVSFTCCS